MSVAQELAVITQIYLPPFGRSAEYEEIRCQRGVLESGDDSLCTTIQVSIIPAEILRIYMIFVMGYQLNRPRAEELHCAKPNSCARSPPVKSYAFFDALRAWSPLNSGISAPSSHIHGNVVVVQSLHTVKPGSHVLPLHTRPACATFRRAS